MATSFVKDPDEALDYGIDVSQWLQDDEVIQSVVWDVPEGLEKLQETNSDTSAVVWLKGGTAGEVYVVEALITTTAGRILNRSFIIHALER